MGLIKRAKQTKHLTKAKERNMENLGNINDYCIREASFKDWAVYRSAGDNRKTKIFVGTKEECKAKMKEIMGMIEANY